MSSTQFSFVLTPSDPTAELGFETWINDQCVFQTDHVKETVTVSSHLPNDAVESQHTLKFVLTGKTQEHTQINENNEILKDATLTVTGLTFDGIELGSITNKLFSYQHNFNGTAADTVESFYGTMGCNGTAELKFSTPIYLWLLENM